MSSISYDVTGISDIGNRSALLQTHLENDVSILILLVSIVYNGVDNSLNVTFAEDLPRDQLEIVGNDFLIIVFDYVPGIDFYTSGPRSVYNGAKSAPNELSDYNEGFTQGSVVYFNGLIYTNIDNTPGAAIWTPINPGDFGFFTTRSGLVVSDNATLDGWDIPAGVYYDNSGGAFNRTTGIFTVTESSIYSMKAIINYETSEPITAQLGAGSTPSFEIRRNVVTPETLIAGTIPVLDVNITSVLTLRTILSSAEVILMGDISLNAGDEIYLEYVSSGLPTPLTLGVPPRDLYWSVHRIS